MLKALSGARILVSTDGTNRLYIDTGTELVPITDVAGVQGGTAGGYYTPSVNNATGEVTWTPSDPTMPAVAPSSIRGPAGRGVFGISLSVDANGGVTGGTVYYDNGDTSKVTITQN